MEIAQYDIVLVDLQVSEILRGHGTEIRKIRPCVVISPDEMNRYLRTVVVAPVTTRARRYPTRARRYPTRVRVRHNQQTGWVIVDQIRTVDRKRVSKRLDRLTHPEIKKLKNVIRVTFVE